MAGIHPRGIFKRYFAMYSEIPKIQLMKAKDIFITMPLSKIVEVYVGKEYSKTLGRATEIRGEKKPLKLTWIKILNPLNIPLAIAKALGIVIVALANKIPSKIVKNVVIAVLGTPLFIIDSFLDLFNKTPTQLYERWKSNKKIFKLMQAGYEADSRIESKPLLAAEEKIATLLPTKKQSIKIDIVLTDHSIEIMKQLAEACTYKNNLDQIKNLIVEIKKDPGYQKYVADYRKEEQFLRDKTSLNLQPPAPQTNLTKDQIIALDAIHDLDKKLGAVKKVGFVTINNHRLEKAIEKIREPAVNQVLRNYAVDDTQKEQPGSKYST